MENNTTRISDLPENIQIYQSNNQMSNSSPPPASAFPNTNGNNYIPINIHPNPYGNSGAPNGVITPIIPPPTGNFYEDEPHQRLPSRDIRISQTNFTQDEEIRANYIPKSQTLKDYLKEYENGQQEEMDEPVRISKHKKNKKRVRFTDDIFLQLQTPILLGALYFIFQMGIINRILYKVTERFFKMYNDDGSIGLYGNLAKSVLFGSAFFAITKAEKIIDI